MSATVPKLPAASPSTSINLPTVRGTGGKALNTLKNTKAPPQDTGEVVHTTLEVLYEIGVKECIEDVIEKVDTDTPEQRKEEEKKITRRIYRIDLLLNYLLYYTAL